MADEDLSYEKVVQAAEEIIEKNERLTLERIRRSLGFGDMIKIAGYLRRWQQAKAKEKAKNKPENDGNLQQAKAHSTSNTDDHDKNSRSDNNHSHKNNHHKKAQKKNNHQKKSDEVVVVINERKNNHYHSKLPPFDAERLAKEKPVIQALFWAILEIKLKKNCVIEYHQNEKNTMWQLLMDAENQIRQLKSKAKDDIAKLMHEQCKVSFDFTSQRDKLRKEY